MSNLSPNHFKARRAEAAKSLDKDSFLLLSSSKNLIRNNDTTFPFRQDSNFYYLTGFEEPESVLMLSSCLLYTSPSPRDRTRSRMPSSA